MDKYISKGIGNNTTHPFIYNFPFFLITSNGVCKSVSPINKSLDKEGLENRLYMNRPDGKISGSFKDGNMGDDCVVGLKISSNIKSGRSSGHDLCKK